MHSPTSVWREPDAIQEHLDKDQYRLYQLIWRRFVASQMLPAIYDVTSVDVKAASCQPERLPHCRRSGCVALPVSCDGLGDRLPGLFAGVRRGHRCGARRRAELGCAASSGCGRGVGFDPADPRATLHRAAAALHGGYVGPGAGKARHRPAQHVCTIISTIQDAAMSTA